MIPSFPDGATIASIHTALVALGRFKSLDSSRATIYGIRVVPENKFGLLAELFAQNALDGALTGSDLIERHTAFPIYASLLADESKRLWKAAQLEGRPGAWARYFPAIVHGDVFAGAPRCCPACVEADREAFGIAYWRVQHQLPSVLVCNVHGSVLHDHCADCAGTYPSGRQGQLPSMDCTTCGGTRSAALRKVKDSPGVRAQAAMIARAAVAEAPELTPETRIQLLRAAFAGKNSETIIQRFYRWWKVAGPAALQKTLGCTFLPVGLQKVVATGAGQIPFALIVSLVAFALEELGADRAKEVVASVRKREEELRHFDKGARSSDDLTEAVRAQARWLDLPQEAVEALLANDAGRAALLVGTLNLVAMVDRLPERHRASLAL